MQSIREFYIKPKLRSDVDSSGFTIIESMVMIAIVSVMVLIVFYAVPGLRRNSVNNSRRDDAQKVLAAVGEHAANNRGQLSDDTDDALGLTETTFFKGHGQGKGEIKVKTLVTYSKNNPLDGSDSDDRLQILLGAECSGDTAVSATAKQYVALFQVETRDGFVPQCLES